MSLAIFLTEDNAIARAHLTQAVREFTGEELVGFATGEMDALTWLITHPDDWGLLILDLFLSDGHGLGVLAGCRVRKPSQKVVVVSNYATPDMRRRCLGLGADMVFDKITELDALMAYCVGLQQRAGLAQIHASSATD
ncbi:response regulator transcription factor [Variovorax ginsengisoli]|uniref:DNA-binding NarL/FixJ family response regulator n=1 Tax=Variovorax ginsengisoli TaxID=363844 RepID=A0ABT9S2Q2_9BURK|nr:response regulator [Variovorax ginsengisoli]MDP9898629.1 DNA-binding NarL/FixJ family response regulator [Variovorax ginsengisoli]